MQKAYQMRGKTIKIFLVDGSPSGIRIAEMGNWTGKAICAPRTRLADVKNRSEVKGSGVYLLSGPDPDNPGDYLVYVGESDVVWNRIESHHKDDDKDYWTEFVAFVSKDENLTKSHTRYLESRLIEEAKRNSAVTLKNSTSPATSLPEPEQEDMESFLDQIRIVLASLGIRILDSTESATRNDKRRHFYMSARGAKAAGFPVENGFLVTKGSTAVARDNESQEKWYRQQKSKLIEKGILKLIKDDLLEFTDDHIFTSSSGAGAVICGSPTSGPQTWKSKDGTTLKKLTEEKLDNGKTKS